MPDFLALFDGILNIASTAKTAEQVSDDSNETESEKVSEETKEEVERVIAKRELEIKERRNSQPRVTDEHRQRHKS